MELLKRLFQSKQGPLRAQLPSGGGDNPGIDPLSGTWLFIDGWAQDRLDAIRKKNDNPSLSERETAILRGKIKILKEISALPDKSAGKGILNR